MIRTQSTVPPKAPLINASNDDDGTGIIDSFESVEPPTPKHDRLPGFRIEPWNGKEPIRVDVSDDPRTYDAIIADVLKPVEAVRGKLLRSFFGPTSYMFVSRDSKFRLLVSGLESRSLFFQPSLASDTFESSMAGSSSSEDGSLGERVDLIEKSLVKVLDALRKLGEQK